jgi:phytol kinase
MMTAQSVISIASVLALLASLMFGLRRFRLQPEHSRKLVHVLMGLTAAAFPWILVEQMAVFVVCALCGLLLAAMRWNRRLRVLTGQVLLAIDRESNGEFYFAAAVGLTFWMTGGALAPYLSAILCLTFADTAASLVGEHLGHIRYPILSPVSGITHVTSEESKSVEGSLAFMLVAFIVVLGVCHVTGIGTARSVPGALAAGVLATVAEALSPHGSDNLTVPVIVAAVLLIMLS